MTELLFLIIGVLVGAIVLYVVLKPKLRAVQKFDEDTAIKNEHLRSELLELTKEHSSLTAKKEEILSMGKNTPFIGVKLTGFPKYTFVNGKLVWQE